MTKICPDSFIDLLKSYGVTCDNTLRAMSLVNRVDFVEPALHPHAWSEQTLPIGNGQTISLPSIVGKMTQALDVNIHHTVLEIGTGCGYQTAVLSPMVRQIYTIERHASLAKVAQHRFGKMRLYNVTSIVDDGSIGFDIHAPYDRIIVTCSACDIPVHLCNQLRIGGIMVVPVGEQDSHQELLKITKTADDLIIEDIGQVHFVPMVEGVAL